MERYYYNITTKEDDYNVWVDADSEDEAEREVRSEYWDIVDLVLTNTREL